MSRFLKFVIIFQVMGFLFLPINSSAIERTHRPEFTRFELGAGGGWSHNSFDDLNDNYLDGIAIPLGILNRNLDDGFTGYVELGLNFSRQLSLFLGYSYITSDIDHRDNITIQDYFYPFGVEANSRTTLNASISSPYIKLKYKILPANPSLFFSIGGALCYGDVELKNRIVDFPQYTQIYRFTASGEGVFGSIGATFALSSRVDFVSELGYRDFQTDDLKDESGHYWLVDSPSPTRMTLSTSGVYFHGGLAIGF